MLQLHNVDMNFITSNAACVLATLSNCRYCLTSLVRHMIACLHNVVRYMYTVSHYVVSVVLASGICQTSFARSKEPLQCTCMYKFGSCTEIARDGITVIRDGVRVLFSCLQLSAIGIAGQLLLDLLLLTLNCFITIGTT